MRELKGAGYRMAMLTNNVREWEPFWRSMLPVDEIFETVLDSGFVGCRKPEWEIYEITLERVGLPAESCLFVDDVLVNCEGAEKAGMTAVHFQDTGQAIAGVRAALAARGAPGPAPPPPAKPGGEPPPRAPVPAERAEGAHEEVAVGDRLAEL